MSGWNSQEQVQAWRKKKVKTWYLFVALAGTLIASIYFLRQNNLKMVELRQAVIIADKTGENLPQVIEDLNNHIFRHMNTTTVRPIELVNTYNRRAQQVIKQASSDKNNNVYQKAAQVCEQRGIPLTSIAECAADYATKNSPKLGPKKITLPDKNLFIYSFVSPHWTPDMAGFSLLLTVVIMVWLVLRFIEYVLVRLTVRHRLKNTF